MEDQEAIDALIAEAKAACQKHRWYVIKMLPLNEEIKSICVNLGLKPARASRSKKESKALDEFRIRMRLRRKPFFATESQAKAYELNGLLEAYEEEKRLSIAISISRILGQLEQLPKVQEKLTETQRIALIARLNKNKIIPLEFVSFVIDGPHDKADSSLWNKRITRANGLLEKEGLAIGMHKKRNRMPYLEVHHLQPNSRDRVEPKKHTIEFDAPESLD